MIVDAARARPGEITLVTLGPLTNLAVALEREPALPRLLRRHVLMGGAFGAPGNTTPTDRVERPLRPGSGADRVPGLGRGHRDGRVGAATARPRPRRHREGARIGPRARRRRSPGAPAARPTIRWHAGRRPARAGSLCRVEPGHPVRRRRPALLLRVPRTLRRLLRRVHPRPAGGRGGPRPDAHHDARRSTSTSRRAAS